VGCYKHRNEISLCGWIIEIVLNARDRTVKYLCNALNSAIEQYQTAKGNLHLMCIISLLHSFYSSKLQLISTANCYFPIDIIQYFTLEKHTETNVCIRINQKVSCLHNSSYIRGRFKYALPLKCL
jgi:hypothetical protein